MLLKASHFHAINRFYSHCTRSPRIVSFSISSKVLRASTLSDSAGIDPPDLQTTQDIQDSSDIHFPPAKKSDHLDPGLYLVATPIGNLEDITFRAIRVLRQASTVLAEDTRHTRILLNHYGIKTRLVSFHQHSEQAKLTQVLEELERGDAVALVSDAGTPLISDPGAGLVAAAVLAGHRVTPIPGACALVTALIATGLPAENFFFVGFLPPKSPARQKRLQELAGLKATLIMYAPPHSLQSILSDASAVLGKTRRCVVARELTKVYEEFYRATLEGAAAEFKLRNAKGEVTLIIEGNTVSAKAATDEDVERRLAELLAGGVLASQAAKQVSIELDISKGRVYDLAVAISKKKESNM